MSGDDPRESEGRGVERAPPARDIPGALGGSRILAHPEVAAEVAELRAAIEGGARALLEVGFDHGRRLTATAAANPGWTVIGLEVRRRRVLAAREWAARRGLENLWAFRLDARAVFANALPAAGLDLVEALFPTPWPAGRARKRLLVTPDFLGDVARALKPGGLLSVATDVPWLAETIASALRATPELTEVAIDEAMARRPACPQRSRREWVCAREGIEVYRFAAQRVGSGTDQPTRQSGASGGAGLGAAAFRARSRKSA